MKFIKDSANPIMPWHTEPALVWIDDILYCYYRTNHSIGVMESKDGLSWKDHDIVLEPSGHGFDAQQVIAPSVLYDNGFPVPKPIDQIRHCVLMELIDAYPL